MDDLRKMREDRIKGNQHLRSKGVILLTLSNQDEKIAIPGLIKDLKPMYQDMIKKAAQSDTASISINGYLGKIPVVKTIPTSVITQFMLIEGDWCEE